MGNRVFEVAVHPKHTGKGRYADTESYSVSAKNDLSARKKAVAAWISYWNEVWVDDDGFKKPGLGVTENDVSFCEIKAVTEELL